LSARDLGPNLLGFTASIEELKTKCPVLGTCKSDSSATEIGLLDSDRNTLRFKSSPGTVAKVSLANLPPTERESSIGVEGFESVISCSCAPGAI
jgi:hypothetical protein